MLDRLFLELDRIFLLRDLLQRLPPKSNVNCTSPLEDYLSGEAHFRNVTEKTLAEAVKKLNHRPRKCLGYRTPHEVFQEAKRGAVAM